MEKFGKFTILGTVTILIVIIPSTTLNLLDFSVNWKEKLGLPTTTASTPTCKQISQNFTSQISKLEKDNKEKSIKLVMSLIKLKSFEDAAKEFWSMKTPLKHVDQIVRQVMDSKENEGKNQPAATVYGFFEEILKRKDVEMRDELSLKLNQSLSRLPKQVINRNNDQLTQNWANKIQNWQFGSIIGHVENAGNESFKNILKMAYARNSSNFDCLSKFNREIQSKHLRAIGWSTLLGELKKSGLNHTGEMWKLAYWIRNETLIEDVGLEEKVFYNKLMNAIPEEQAKLIWGSRCTIKNLNTRDYLSAFDGVIENDIEGPLSRANVFATSDVGTGSWWRLEPFVKYYYGAKTDVIYFSIKSSSFRKDFPYLGISRDTLSRKELLSGDVGTYNKTELDSHIMMNWVLVPSTTVNGENVFQMFTWNTEWQRFDLYVGQKQVKVLETDGARLKGTEVLAEEEGYKLDESYWEIVCEL